MFPPNTTVLAQVLIQGSLGAGFRGHQDHMWPRALQTQALHSETFLKKCLREEETRLLTCKSWQVLNLVFARKGNRYHLLLTEHKSLPSMEVRLLV